MLSVFLTKYYLYPDRHDTLFLNSFDPLNSGRFLFQNKYITTFDSFEGKSDGRITNAKLVDLNGDGVNELLMLLHGGFSKQPRGLFAYDAVHDTIFRTPVLGAGINKIICTDINKDGKPEIYCLSNTVGNIPDSLGIPYNDYSSWFMGFDEKLHFLFKPVEFNTYTSSCRITTVQSGGKTRIAALFRNNGNSPPLSMIGLFNEKGQMIRKRFSSGYHLKNFFNNNIFTLKYKNITVIAIAKNEKNLLLLDTLLNPVATVSVPNPPQLLCKTDLNGDGRKELIFKINNNNLYITQPQLKYPVIIPVNQHPFSKIPFCVSIKKNGSKLPEIFIKSENRAYTYTYQFNKLYYLKFPVWIGLYLVILSFILFIRHIQNIQLQHKLEIENRLNALQLKTIKSQMDPHFMFNTLNSISTSILNQQAETAHRFLVKFSTLLRSMFSKAGELTVPLEEQLIFVNNYLELEKLRFKERINYNIVVDPGVDKNIRLPHMFIQLFVENAIKHGLRHKKGNGHLLIKVAQDTSLMKIIIEDDGIGRQAAAQHHDGHGKGTVIINEMVGLYAKVKGIHIKYHYEDLTDKAGNPTGTRVLVEVPVVPPDLSVR